MIGFVGVCRDRGGRRHDYRGLHMTWKSLNLILCPCSCTWVFVLRAAPGCAVQCVVLLFSE